MDSRRQSGSQSNRRGSRDSRKERKSNSKLSSSSSASSSRSSKSWQQDDKQSIQDIHDGARFGDEEAASQGSGQFSPVRRTISTPSLYPDEEKGLGDRQSATYRSHPQLSITRRINTPRTPGNKLPAISDLPAEPEKGAEPIPETKTVQLPSIHSGGSSSDLLSASSSGSSGKSLDSPIRSGRTRAETLLERYGEVAAIAEDEIQHNWVLAEQDAQRQKLTKARNARILLSLAEPDPLVAIEQRLEELSLMAKPRRDTSSALEKLPQGIQDQILKIKDIPISSQKKAKRKGWKNMDLLRWACGMVALMGKCTEYRKQYYTEKHQLAGSRRRMERNMDQLVSDGSRPSLSLELVLALTTQPHLRDNQCLKRILRLLRAVKSFHYLFPADMEREVARYVGYERYEDSRIIAQQGRPPERFYYVITGQMAKLRQFRLSTGQVTKLMGTLTKGSTTDAELMERQTPRDDYLVAKGSVEVLTLDKKAFDYLSNAMAGPPVEFLRSLDLFQEFPVNQLAEHPDAVESKFYGHGRILVNDSNRTPWIHIIKSGTVQIVRHQRVVDTPASNESKFNSPRIEALGCGRSSSHADAMLGTQNQQRKHKQNNTLQLPQINEKNNSLVAMSNPHSSSIGIEIEGPTPQYENVGDEATLEEQTTSRFGTATPEKNALPVMTLTVPGDVEDDDDACSVASGSSGAPRDPSTSAPDASTPLLAAVGMAGKIKSKATSTMPNIPVREETALQRHLFAAARNPPKPEVDTDGQMGGLMPGHDAPQRWTFVQLGVMTTGDIFGLDHLQPALASEPRGFSLLSGGAEVIKISKRFFLQNAGNNAMLKVETMANDYISEDDAKQLLYTEETWSQYKAAMWQHITAHLPARNTPALS